MSNEHTQAIKRTLDEFPNSIILGPDAADIFAGTSAEVMRHVAALAARVERLQQAYLDAENDSVTYALPEHNANNPHRQVTRGEWVRTLREAHLDDGDLPKEAP